EGTQPMPFMDTEARVALQLKRMLRMAAEQPNEAGRDYEYFAWTPAHIHQKRWGTDSISWQKVDLSKAKIVETAQTSGGFGSFIIESQGGQTLSEFGYSATDDPKEITIGRMKENLVGTRPEAMAAAEAELKVMQTKTIWSIGAAEQEGGEIMHNGEMVNIEELARQRGELLEKNGELVTSREALKEVIRSVSERQNYGEVGPLKLERLTKRAWDEMQKTDSGGFKPREEGLGFYYDKMYPKVAEKVLKKLVGKDNAKLEVIEIADPGEGEVPLKALAIRMTPELKAKILEQGFTLFQKDESGPRGRIRFGGPEGFQIELLEKANKSTYFHEMGHYYLEVLGDLAEDSSAPQDVMDDYQVLLDWFGVESRDQIGTEQHEQFARGFEAYIMEGKAPSLALRRAFHRFKTWLVNVYKQIRALDVELTEDVRSVMGRLLATEAEISEGQAKYGILSDLPLGQNLKALTDPRTFGMTGKAAERFTEAVEEAKRAAEEQLMAELMAGYKRENERAWKEERNNVKQEILKELDEQPMYKALSILQRGKLPSGEPAPQGMEDLKLDRKSLVDVYGAEFVKNTLPRPFVYSREGGQHHDMVAPYFGYDSGDEMIQDLVVAQPVKQFVEQESQRRMMQKYPDIIHDTAAMEAKAMEAIHNDKQARLYSLMLDWLWENQKGQAKEAIRRGVRGLPSNKDMKELA
ncbi:MAG: hypothetical protein ACXABY_32830, partial [Candidatus Thorarchaeota archaeon]